MKIKNLCLWIFILLTLASCTTSPETTTDPAEIDLTTLTHNIDVGTAAALQTRDDVVFVDVREQWEYDAGHIPNITHVPMSELPGRLAEIPTDKTVIVTCQVGGRSSQVTQALLDSGYTKVHNMTGGIKAWQNAGYAVDVP